jgi:SAM-dependent MidA family methyltransferase
VVFVDYGAPAADLAALPAGTLLTYSDTGVDDDVLARPGHKDITSHVNWTAVVAACRRAGLEVWGPRPQRSVLTALGLPRLDADLRAAHDQAVSARDGAAALRALSRRQALGVLADPGGLGGLDVLVAGRGIPVPAFVGR